MKLNWIEHDGCCEYLGQVENEWVFPEEWCIHSAFSFLPHVTTLNETPKKKLFRYNKTVNTALLHN